MSIVVYWLDKMYGMQLRELKSSELLTALQLAEDLRKAEHRHISISTEFEDSVGKPGVSDVLPEGYDWKKRRV